MVDMRNTRTTQTKGDTMTDEQASYVSHIISVNEKHDLGETVQLLSDSEIESYLIDCGYADSDENVKAVRNA